MYFIAGMLFIYFVVPLIEGLLSFLLVWIKEKETNYTAEIYKIQQAINSESDTAKAVVGFVYKEEEEEE